MAYDPEIHHRRSVRLKEFNYSRHGAYFITICTQNKDCLFGKIVEGKMVLNEYGSIVETEWTNTSKIRNNVKLDEFIVMPSHVHGIIIIMDDCCEGTRQRAPTGYNAPITESFGKPTHNSIPTIIRSFKSAVTKQINELRNTPKLSLWQNNYYEHIIRNENELNQIRQYIIENPLKWDLDEENPLYKL